MFYLLSSDARKVRINAAHWLELSQDVLNVRRDVLAPRDLAELSGCRNELAQLLKAKAASEKIKDAITRLETSLRTSGGALYPRSWWAEYTDFFLVAAIVILGIRAYFVQPMAIPTNSMWPSYYGMTAEPFIRDEDTPGLISRLFRFVAFGAIRKTIDAPKSGEVAAPFFLDTAGQPHLAYTAKEGRSWYGFPEKISEYTFYVDGEPVSLRVLEDFHEMDDVFLGTFFPDRADFVAQWHRAQSEGRIKRTYFSVSGTQYPAYIVPLGKTLKTGVPVIRFDLLKGDMLFADRFSYHFIRPTVGSGILFETGKVPGIVKMGKPDEYYIKRLVGLPGDTLEIKEPVLFRNGKPIEGSSAFALNALRQDNYHGYLNATPGHGEYLAQGKSIVVPPDSFMALGDNSGNSEDSRYWGFVPKEAVIGKPLFTYYPFSRRWGPSH